MKNMMESEQERTPLDAIIQRVESYIENPKLATKETLSELKDDLVDLKSYMDGDEENMDMEEEKEMSPMPKGKGHGLTVIIGSMGRKK